MTLVLGNPAPGFVIGNRFGPRKPIDLDGDGIGDTASEHGGQDLYSLRGGPKSIVAAAGGVVVAPPYDASAGTAVCIVHQELGLWTGYAHLSARATTIGQHVERGQYLGLEGATGKATAAHLHFDVGIGAPSAFRRVDPLLYIDFSTKASGTKPGAPTDPIARAMQEDPPMFVIQNRDTSDVFTVGQQFIRHETDEKSASYLARVLTAEDAVISADSGEFAMVVDSLGIPRSAPKRLATERGTAWSAAKGFHDPRQW